MARQEDEQSLITPAVISPTRMLESRLPAMALDPRYAGNCSDVRPENGVLKKRTGYAAFDVDIASSGNITGRVVGLSQTPFGWDDDIVALVQNLTNSTYYVWDDSANNWVQAKQQSNTAYSQLSWCPGVTSGGVEVVILSDDKIPIQTWVTAGTVAPIAFDTAGTIKAKIVRYYKDHLCMFNVDDGTRDKKMVKWTGVADITDDTGGSSASNLILGRTGGYIVGAQEIVDTIAIYCQREIIRMTHVGGTSIFRFDPMVETGLAAQNAIADLGDRHLFLADDFTIQEYCGGQYCRPVGDPINTNLQAAINKTYAANSFFVVAKGLMEAWLFVPTSGETPDTVYAIKYGGCVEEYCWHKYSMSAWAAMVYDNWYVLSGFTNLINDYDYNSKSDGATAIDGYYETIDFTNVRDPSQTIRHEGIRFEATGDEVTVAYSTDEGSSWTDIVTQTLTNAWVFYQSPVDTGYERKIRYRFRNNTAGETFELKWFQPVMLPGGSK